MNGRRQAAGFTLLELVVAITLLALVLSALMPALQQGLSGLGRGSERAEALTLARSLLAVPSVDGGQQPVEESTSGKSGEFEWSVSREPYLEDEIGIIEPEQSIQPMLVSATVSWADGRQELVLRTLSLDPVEK